jgi:hypothetical protein
MAVEAMETAKKHEDVLRVLEKWSMQRPMPIMPATMTLREQDEMLGIIPKESEQE